MRYKIICPQFMYYLGLMPYIIGPFALSFMARVAMRKEQLEVGLVLYTFSGVIFILTVLYLSKFIYGQIDTQTNTFIFGNLLFRQEVPVTSVKKIGHYLFYRSCYKIEIEGRWFYILNTNEDQQIFSGSPQS